MHHDAREPAAGVNLGPLPEWDLGDLYVSPQASELNADIEWLRGDRRGASGLHRQGLLDAATD